MLFRSRRHVPTTPWSSGDDRASPRALIDAVYLGVLSRPATEPEIEQAWAKLDAGQPLAEIIRSLLQRKLFFERLESAPSIRRDRLMNDASQFGEIEILLKHVVNAACPHRVVVDVGARGLQGSNSYDLMRHFGWRGLLVEANPRLIEAIQRDFAGLDCEVEGCAVSDFEGEASFSIGVNDDVSSLDQTMAASWGPVAGEVQVAVRRLAPLLERHSVPLDFDLLSLDIERHDVRVLNDLIGTSAYRPKWVIFEAPSGALFNDLATVGCSPAVQRAYTVVDLTLANFILRHNPAGAAQGPV